MFIVDLVLSVVPACLLLIRFCWLLRHLTEPRQSRHDHAQPHTNVSSNWRPFPLKKSTTVTYNGFGTIHHSDRQPVCHIEQFQFNSSEYFTPVQGRRHNEIGLMHDSDIPRVRNIQQLQLHSSQRLARSQGKWYGGFGMIHHSDRQQV
jgi:hypothetical protein